MDKSVAKVSSISVNFTVVCMDLLDIIACSVEIYWALHLGSILNGFTEGLSHRPPPDPASVTLVLYDSR